MRQVLILVILITVCLVDSSAQKKLIKGLIISENIETLPGVRIHDADTLLLGTTDIDGRFSIDIPEKTPKLIFSFAGMEWTSIKLSWDCDNFEVIMMVEVIYDFASLKRINKLRKKRFEKLHKIRESAIEAGFFEAKCVCYSQDFTPYSIK